MMTAPGRNIGKEVGRGCKRHVLGNGALTIISAMIGDIFPQREARTLAVKITTSPPTMVDATQALLSTCTRGTEAGARAGGRVAGRER